MDKDLSEIFSGLAEGRIIPYLGPGLLPEAGATLPSELPALAEVLSKSRLACQAMIGEEDVVIELLGFSSGL